MDRSRIGLGRLNLALLIALGTTVPFTGCHQLVATAVYVWGGTEDPAEYAGLEGQRVVVVCRPPSSLEFSHAGAAHELARRVSSLLQVNGEEIDVVDPKEVENWADESDWDDFRELASALDADMVLHVELQDFGLHNGPTLYQGTADVILTVYDMRDDGQLVWEKALDDLQFPANSAVPVQEKRLRQFRRQFIEVLAERIAWHFYAHDPRIHFALDATAHR